MSSLIDEVEAKVALAQGDFSRLQRARFLLAGGLWRSSNAETQEQRFSKPIGKSLALRVSDLGAWSYRCHPHYCGRCSRHDT